MRAFAQWEMHRGDGLLRQGMRGEEIDDHFTGAEVFRDQSDVFRIEVLITAGPGMSATGDGDELRVGLALREGLFFGCRAIAAIVGQTFDLGHIGHATITKNPTGFVDGADRRIQDRNIIA